MDREDAVRARREEVRIRALRPTAVAAAQVQLVDLVEADRAREGLRGTSRLPPLRLLREEVVEGLVVDLEEGEAQPQRRRRVSFAEEAEDRLEGARNDAALLELVRTEHRVRLPAAGLPVRHEQTALAFKEIADNFAADALEDVLLRGLGPQNPINRELHPRLTRALPRKDGEHRALSFEHAPLFGRPDSNDAFD